MNSSYSQADFSIFPCREEHCEDLGKLHVKLWKEAYEHVFSKEFLDSLDPAKRARMWRNNLLEKKQMRLVVSHNDQLIGFCGAGPAREEGMGYRGEIYAIYLLKEYYGRGLATEMMKRMFEFLTIEGYENAYVWVLEDNPRARSFYEKCSGRLLAQTKVLELDGKSHKEVSYGFEKISVFV